MPEVKVLKYLGEFLSFSSEESVHQTVLNRVKVATQSIYEIRAVVEDFRAQHLGGINVAYDIWETAVIGMVLYNSETWDIIQNRTMKILNNLFNEFHRIIWRIGVGCPIPNMYRFSGSILPVNLILPCKDVTRWGMGGMHPPYFFRKNAKILKIL